MHYNSVRHFFYVKRKNYAPSWSDQAVCIERYLFAFMQRAKFALSKLLETCPPQTPLMAAFGSGCGHVTRSGRLVFRMGNTLPGIRDIRG